MRAPVTDALTGALAAVQAFALSLAVTALPALVSYLVAHASGTVADDDGQRWRTPLEIGSGIWLLAHGIPVTASGATFSLVPLGLTALALFVCRVTARRAARATWWTWGAATLTYALGTTALAVAVPSVSGWTVAAAFTLGAFVGGLGFGLGVLSRPEARPVPGFLDRVPPTAWLGARAGGLAVVTLAGVAALLVGVWAVAGRSTSSDIIRALDPGWAGGLVLGVAQLVLLPDLVLWAVAWLSGAGFAVGTGTSFTPLGVESGPLPAVPLLAALPAEDWAGAYGGVVPVVVVACGALAGWYAWRSLEVGRARWSDVGIVLGGLTVSAGALVWLLQVAASGTAGTARLLDVGATPWLTALLVAGEVALGAAVVLVTAVLLTRRAA